MPRSRAVRMMRSASDALTWGSARCHPPRPMAETRSPVLPSRRVGTSAMWDLLPDDVRSGAMFATPRRRWLADELLERAAERGLGLVPDPFGGPHDGLPVAEEARCELHAPEREVLHGR